MFYIFIFTYFEMKSKTRNGPDQNIHFSFVSTPFSMHRAEVYPRIYKAGGCTAVLCYARQYNYHNISNLHLSKFHNFIQAENVN